LLRRRRLWSAAQRSRKSNAIKIAFCLSESKGR
jgi:hypothetical protein